MEKFTHGVMAIDPTEVDENDAVSIVHFIGLWEAPTKEAFLEYEKEIKTDPEFGLVEISDRVVVLPAPDEIIEMYNEMITEDHETDN